MAKAEPTAHHGGTPDLEMTHPAPVAAMSAIIDRLQATRQHFTRFGDGSIVCVRSKGAARLRLTDRGIALWLMAYDASGPEIQAEFDVLFDEIGEPRTLVAE